MLVNFKELYYKQIITDLKERFSYKNPHQVPKISKIVINMGVGKAAIDSKLMDNAVRDLTLISGQKPVVTKAKKSIANFKLREGLSIGCKVTLRKQRMYDFLERLVITALPRIKNFRGFSVKNFDQRGNLNFGIKEQSVFSEIDYDRIDITRGMNITIVTTAKNDKEGKELLAKFHLPFYN